MTYAYLSRRRVLQSLAAIAASVRPRSAAIAQSPPTAPVELPVAHQSAVNRRRRIVVQYDAFNTLGIDFRDWIDYRFSYADEPGRHTGIKVTESIVEN